MRLSESKGLKAATMVFVKVGICLEIQRTPGKLGDGNAHDVKRVTLMALFLALSFFPVPVIEAAANAWRVAGALIGQPLVVVVVRAERRNAGRVVVHVAATPRLPRRPRGLEARPAQNGDKIAPSSSGSRRRRGCRAGVKR